MKKRLLLFVLLTMVLVGCVSETVMTSQAVEVPAEIRIAIEVALVTVFSSAFAWILTKIPKLDLRGFSTPLSISLASWLVAELQGYINSLPESQDPMIALLFRVVVVILGGIGTLALVRGKEASQKSLL